MNEPLLPDHPEAATLRTVTGWVSRNRGFYGDDEKLARWDGSTHVRCSTCNQPTPKTYTMCESCRHKADVARWEKLPLAEYSEPFCLDDGDKYFFSLEDFYDWWDDQDYGDSKMEDCRLLVCEPQYFRRLDSQYWEDDLPEDDGYADDLLPEDIRQAVDALNTVIAAHKEPACWRPGRQRLIIKDERSVEDRT